VALLGAAASYLKLTPGWPARPETSSNTMETINEAGGKSNSCPNPGPAQQPHAGKMIMTVFAGIGEFERDLIRERTVAGREAARQRGVRFGRPRKLNTDQVKVAAQP